MIFQEVVTLPINLSDIIKAWYRVVRQYLCSTDVDVCRHPDVGVSGLYLVLFCLCSFYATH